MKKVIFYTAALIAFGLLVHIISIVVTDLDRLTQYGYGFLTGKILLFLAFVIIAFFTRKTIAVKK